MTRGDGAGVSANTAELVTLAEQYGLQQRAMGLAYRSWHWRTLECQQKVLNSE